MPISVVLTNARVRLSTTTSTTAVVIGTTTTGATPEGTGMIDISDQVSRVRLTREFDEHDSTTMGYTAHLRVPGLENWNMDLELVQSFSGATGADVDTLFYDILAQKLPVWVALRACNTARSSANPEYYGIARSFSYSPIDGGAGDLLKSTPSFRSYGNLNRSVSTSGT